MSLLSLFIKVGAYLVLFLKEINFCLEKQGKDFSQWVIQGYSLRQFEWKDQGTYITKI